MRQHEEDFEYDEWLERVERFADPGGESALWAATHDKCPACKKKVGTRDDFCKHCGSQMNPRKHPCPTCGTKNVLTQRDLDSGYCCDVCADRQERGLDLY